MTEVRKITEASEWDEMILGAGGHPLQLWGWGNVKQAHGWKPLRLAVSKEEKVVGWAQVLIKRLPGPLTALSYIPRGPVCKQEDREAVLVALVDYVKASEHPVVLTIEPDWEGEWQAPGWHKSTNTVLIPRTLIVDLALSEEDLLAAMTKKTRQYIRKSEKEVTIRQVKSDSEIEACLAIYHQTAERAGFALHSDQYYRDIFHDLDDHSPVFAAFRYDKIVAFLWVAISSETAFELYGGMNEEGQELRANYALKWQTMCIMKRWGIRRYDMNGLLNDGVSTFKQGFAQHENQLVGTYDMPLSPLYGFWSKGLPFAKKIVRAIKKR